MNKVFTFLGGLILGVFLCIFYFEVGTTNNEEYLEYRKKTERTIDSLKTTLVENQIRIDHLNLQKDSLNLQKDSLYEEILFIKKRTNEKVDLIDNFSNNELQSFFTERYSVRDTSNRGR